MFFNSYLCYATIDQELVKLFVSMWYLISRYSHCDSVTLKAFEKHFVVCLPSQLL